MIELTKMVKQQVIDLVWEDLAQMTPSPSTLLQLFCDMTRTMSLTRTFM